MIEEEKKAFWLVSNTYNRVQHKLGGNNAYHTEHIAIIILNCYSDAINYLQIWCKASSGKLTHIKIEKQPCNVWSTEVTKERNERFSECK